MQLTEKPIHYLRELLHSGEITAKQLVTSVFERIDEVDAQVGAYITLNKEEAFKAAERADEMLKQGDARDLLGIPIAVKDNISTKGLRTTCASKVLENYVPAFDATAVAKLKEAGAIIIGKTNLDEFGLGSSTENSMYKATRNPWDLSRVPGGSSGGSAAAVAAGAACGALGSDTGGSVRQPAAFCGIVGLKPTYGLVSRYGLIPAAPSMDHIGPMTQDVRDAAILLQTIAGPDGQDPTSGRMQPENYEAALTEDIKSLVVGMPAELIEEVEDAEVKEALFGMANVLESLGATVRKVSLPHSKFAVACFYLLAACEVSSSLASLDGVRLGSRVFEAEDTVTMFSKTRGLMGKEAKRRILVGTAALSGQYRKTHYERAQKLRTLIKTDLAEALDECCVLLLPTAPSAAFPLGHKVDDPVAMYQSDVFTSVANLAGIPALSLPCGYTKEGLPLGVQILGRPFDEVSVLKVGHAFEQGCSMAARRPKLEVGTSD